MKKDLELWNFIAERLEQNRDVQLLVVAQSSGSSPGRQGFKMAVSGDETEGSIGGGVMEVSLVEQAKRGESGVRSPKSKVIRQIHRRDVPDSSGMICSGSQTVVLVELDCGDLETVWEIIDALENQKDFKLRITNYELRVLASEAGDRDFRFERSGEEKFIFEEKLGYKNKLFIIGGGHCALALSELMAKMDFYISLFDDRPGLNTLAKNEFVHKKTIIESYENIGDFISSGKSHYVVVMTLGYKFDEIVVRQLFEKDFKYFGVLGSRAKMAVLWRDLLNEGFARERLDKIHTPVGLNINSQTPEEIAVSIAGEIIAVKNTKG